MTVDNKIIMFIGTLGMIILAILIVAFVIYERRKVEKQVNEEKEKRLKAERQNEINKINNLIRNNLHNQQSDRGILTNMLKNQENSREVIIKYNELYNDYSNKASKNWLAQTVTLKDAIDAAEMYLTAIKVRYPDISLVKGNIPDQEKIRFIPAVLEKLVNNSVFRGLRKKSYNGQISFTIYKEEENLVCIVEDTGEPPSSNEAFFRREGSGLNLMKQQIEYLYFEYSKEMPQEYCSAKIRDNREGTSIKLILPYAKV